MIFNKTTFLVLSLLFSSFLIAGELPKNTNISKQVQNFFTEFEKSEAAKKLSKDDWATFEKRKKDLAAEMPNPGLKVGDKAPDFKLKNAFGKEVKLSSLNKKGPVILVFYRGGWCAICNIQLHSLNTSLPTFKKYGAQLLAVTPQKPDRSKEQIKKDGYPFEVLSDLDYSVLKKYKLYFEVPDYINKLYQEKFGMDLADYNGKGRYGLPVPATYIIDKKGIIRAAYANTDYTQRMEPEDILIALKKL
ncbi:MAG: peroxiredoxin-like family protein [Thiohalomonadales bacterium]